MGIRYFHDACGFIAVTPETPKGPLKGLVFVGRGPTVPGKIVTIQEQAYSTEQLLKLMPLSSLDVPDEWIAALGYEQPKHPLEPPTFSPQSPEPKPPREKSWRERRRKQTKPEPQIVELVVGSPYETPVLGRLLWLVGVLILLGIYLLARS
jgi:hypothetical protein